MGSISPEDSLNNTEIENLDRLEGVAQHGLHTHAEVADALAEIRDARLYRGTHRTFEAYLCERWRINCPGGSRVIGTPEVSEAPAVPDALATLWHEVLEALGSEVTATDIRLTVHKLRAPGEPAADPQPTPDQLTDLVNGRLFPQLRWLLTQSGGTIADVAYQLESHPFELDEDAREQLRDDVLVIEEELAMLKTVLASVDWDAELGRLLSDEISPPEGDADSEDE
jgi:hypothetical protein